MGQVGKIIDIDGKNKLPDGEVTVHVKRTGNDVAFEIRMRYITLDEFVTAALMMGEQCMRLKREALEVEDAGKRH